MASKLSQSFQHNFETKIFIYICIYEICMHLDKVQIDIAHYIGKLTRHSFWVVFHYWLVSWLYRCLLHDFSVDKFYLVLATILICVIFCNKTLLIKE